MSYMRGEWYVYDDGKYLHIQHHTGSARVPNERMDELAAMIWHRRSPEEQAAILQRVAENYGGNFGVDGVMTALGEPTVVDMLREVRGSDG